MSKSPQYVIRRTYNSPDMLKSSVTEGIGWTDKEEEANYYPSKYAAKHHLKFICYETPLPNTACAVALHQ